jgi:hypothetical protein
MSSRVERQGREWEYWPGEDGEPFIDNDGNEVLGWHDRSEDQDEFALLADFEAYYRSQASPERVDVSLTLRPILMREATDVECRIYGWEEGTLTRCTTRAKHSYPMWQIEAPSEPREEK